MTNLRYLVISRLINKISGTTNCKIISRLSCIKRSIIEPSVRFVIRIWGHFKLHFYPININKLFVDKYVNRKQYDNHTEQIAPDEFQGGFHLRSISRNCFVRRHINILSLLQTHNTTKSLNPIFIFNLKEVRR